jgi:hypothetical protein
MTAAERVPGEPGAPAASARAAHATAVPPVPRTSAGPRSFAQHLRDAPQRPADSMAERVTAIAERLGVRPSDLMAVMRFESGLRPDAVNPATHAVGLIQFLPRTAADLLDLPRPTAPAYPGAGATPAQLAEYRRASGEYRRALSDRDDVAVRAFASMTADEQLDYVERYFERVLQGRRSLTARDTYMAVLFPAAVGRGDGYVLGRVDAPDAFGRAVYRQNAALDANGDGTITAGEAARVAKIRG